MNNKPNQLDAILSGNLQPWLDENTSDDTIRKLMSEISYVKPNFKELYAFDFYRPQNLKAEYYYKLIENETHNFCNAVIAQITEFDNQKRQQQLYDDFCKNILPKRLQDVIEIIKDNHFFIEYVDPRKLNFEVNTDHKINSYIIQLLKLSFIKIYLEIQNLFKHLSKEALLTEEDIYNRFLNQGIPENSFLKLNIVQENSGSKTETAEPSQKELTQSVSRHSFTYKKIDTDSDKLTDLFKRLKDNKFIADENSLANFKRAFSGNQVSNQVIWTGTVNEFHYFIYLLHDKLELVEPIKRRYWSVACKCFLKADGTQFNAQKLKEVSKPAERSEQLEEAVGLLKQ